MSEIFTDEVKKQTNEMAEQVFGKQVVIPQIETPFTVIVKFIVNPHCHLREAIKRMALLIEKAVEGGARALGPMPNTIEGLKTAKEVAEYIRYAKSQGIVDKHRLRFIPICMITPDTTVDDILECVAAGVYDFKVYPFQRTTQSEYGVKEYWPIIELIRDASYEALKRFNVRIRVHFHPEHPDEIYDNDDAEYGFIPIAMMVLESTAAIFVWEHGTDAQRCVLFWKKMAAKYPGRFYLTITAHHLVSNSTKTFGDVRATCKPSFKKEESRVALIDLIAENHYWVMLGADDAPHPMEKKHVHEGQCACGAYTAPFLIQLCAHALKFLLKRGPEGVKIFTNFTTTNACEFYGIEEPEGSITLQEGKYEIQHSYTLDGWTIESFWAGKSLDLFISKVDDPALVTEY